MKKFFPFLSTSTTVVSLFVGLFGITAFSYMLIGQEFTMFDIHKIFELLPNPLDFVRDGTSLFNFLFNRLHLPNINMNYSGDNIFTLLYNFVRVFVNAVAWVISAVLMLMYFLVFGPIYCIWYVLRIVVIVSQVLGIDTSGMNALTGNWNMMQTLTGLAS